MVKLAIYGDIKAKIDATRACLLKLGLAEPCVSLCEKARRKKKKEGRRKIVFLSLTSIRGDPIDI